jgi:glycosyltransferase involved in cell wall biosynthesis
MGIVAEESLACGTPVLHIKRLTAEESKAIIKIDEKDANKKIKDFFSLPEAEKKKLRAEARNYAEKYLSGEVWKDKYIDFYLK